jgi:hypothetical protein
MGLQRTLRPSAIPLRGWRARARAELKNGDVVVIVGIKGQQTQPAEQSVSSILSSRRGRSYLRKTR